MKGHKLQTLFSLLVVLVMLATAAVPTSAKGEEVKYLTFATGVDTVWWGDKYGNTGEAVPTWTHPAWVSIDGAAWIWTEELVSNPEEEYVVTFKQFFTLPAEFVGAKAKIYISSDNTFELYVNNVFVGASLEEFTFSKVLEFDITEFLKEGQNKIRVVATNFAAKGADSYSNPAGIIYKVVIGKEVEDPKPEPMTIVDMLMAENAKTGEFSTLLAAMEYTGFTPILDDGGQWTLFAPTDEAFAKLGLDKDSIVKLDMAKVKKILMYHVAKGEFFAEELVAAGTLKMLNKEYVKIMMTDEGMVKVNKALVLEADLDACNGVFHVIDQVLMMSKK